MRWLVILGVLAGLGFCVYRFAFASSEAYQTYSRFADAMLYDRWDDARDLASGNGVEETIDESESIPMSIGYERYRQLRGVVHGSPWRTIESETASDDGRTVTLQVVQDVRRGSATMSPIGPATVRYRHQVVMVKTAEGWKVEEFEEAVEPLSDR